MPTLCTGRKATRTAHVIASARTIRRGGKACLGTDWSAVFAIGGTPRFIATRGIVSGSIGAVTLKRLVSSVSADLGAAQAKFVSRGLVTWNGGLRLRLQSALCWSGMYKSEGEARDSLARS
jgi:hypothetical protein